VDISPEKDPNGGTKGLVGVGVGAGLLGAAMLGLRYLIRPPTKERIPETISPVRFATRAFQSSRGQMIYHESGGGPGPAIVFIHNVGVGASSYEWSKVYPAFAERHRVLVPDLLGFGESERPQARLNASDYAASLADFLQALCADDAQKPIIVARGLGAGFAALMAAQHPELPGRLLLWMPSGRANVPFRLNLASRLPPLNRFIYRNRIARRSTIRARFAAKGAFVDPAAVTAEMVEVHAICAQQFQADCAIYRLMQGCMNFDLDPRFRELNSPVTLLWPELAAPASFAHAQRLQASNRLCALRVVPKAGPFAPLEAPHLVTAVLQDELHEELRVLKAAS
jgi:haloalkane dehalogenase